MTYQRKTTDEWHLLINYGGGWEHETTEDSRREAVDMRRCYWENCPQYPTKIVKRRVKIEEIKT